MRGEDGTPGNLAGALGVSEVAVFNTPVGSANPGPGFPGDAYEWTISALPGDKLSIATMYVQSNDLVLAPSGRGIPLFTEDGRPIDGDVSNLLLLWDSGTEVNGHPGTDRNQAPRQSGPDTGIDENGVVRPVQDAFTYPSGPDVIQVTLTPPIAA